MERRGGGVGGATAGGRALVLGASEPVRYGVQQARYGAVVKKRLDISTCRSKYGLVLAQKSCVGMGNYGGIRPTEKHWGRKASYGAVVKKRLGRSTCSLGCGLGLAEEIVRESVQFSKSISQQLVVK